MTLTKKGNHYYTKTSLLFPERTLWQRLVDWLTGAPKKSVTPVTLDQTTPEQEAIYAEAPWLRNAWDGYDAKDVGDKDAT